MRNNFSWTVSPKDGFDLKRKIWRRKNLKVLWSKNSLKQLANSIILFAQWNELIIKEPFRSITTSCEFIQKNTKLFPFITDSCANTIIIIIVISCAFLPRAFKPSSHCCCYPSSSYSSSVSFSLQLFSLVLSLSSIHPILRCIRF